MTRENLIQAIYDNEENWSCAYSCPHTMEEENPKDVCWKCAEKLLSEYEQKIKTDVIEEVEQIIHNIYTGNLYYIDDMCEKHGMGCDDCLYAAISNSLHHLKQTEDGGKE